MSTASTTRETGLPFLIRAPLCALLVVLVLAAGTRLDFRQPFIGYGFGGAFLLYVAADRSAKRLAMLGSVGAVLIAWVVWGRLPGPGERCWCRVIGALGLASLLLLSSAVLWNGRDREAAAYRALFAGGRAVVSGSGSAILAKNMASLLHDKTLDAYAFAFDGSLGFEPSFVLGRLLNSNPWLFPFVKVSYEGILLAMAALYAGFMGAPEPARLGDHRSAVCLGDGGLFVFQRISRVWSAICLWAGFSGCQRFVRGPSKFDIGKGSRACDVSAERRTVFAPNLGTVDLAKQSKPAPVGAMRGVGTCAGDGIRYAGQW